MTPLFKQAVLSLVVFNLSACQVHLSEPSESVFDIKAGIESKKQASDQPFISPIGEPAPSGRPKDQTVPSLVTARNSSLVQQTGPALTVTEPITLAAQDMPIADFCNTVFGQLLKLDYVLDDNVSNSRSTITLKIDTKTEPLALYNLAVKVLDEKGIQTAIDGQLLYIRQRDNKNDSSREGVSLAIGRSLQSIPQVSGTIMQVVPLRYQSESNIRSVVSHISSAEITYLQQRRLMIIKGNAAQVERVLALVDILDTPARQGSHIRILGLQYASPQSFIADITVLLEKEGIGVGKSGELSIVPLGKTASVVVFANSAAVLARANYWRNKLDKLPEGEQAQFFIYKPLYSAAADLGESITSVLQIATVSNQDGNDGTAAVENNVSVDENQNALLFYMSPTRYKNILNVLRQLDIAPKQVALEVNVAEITLSGSLSRGVEWFLRGQGNSNAQNINFSAGNSAGGAITYALNKLNGNLNLLLGLLESESEVKILSSPRLVVRDGKTANINVGTQVPIITTQASDADAISDRIVQSVQYRNTGVTLSVTPVINSDGAVAMKINQTVSEAGENTLSSVSSPLILQRSIDTEVIAPSGQTIALGGLISDNRSNAQTRIPWFGRIPFLNLFFSNDNKSRTRTELIITITPRVIQGVNNLDDLRQLLKTPPVFEAQQ